VCDDRKRSSCSTGKAQIVSGYTNSMKVAVSIPDEVFQRAESWARRARQSRSEVYSRALREYVSRHAPDDVTDAMDRFCEAVGDQHEPFVAAASRRTLKRSEW
jgi:metal-responsive CopG/Arc/MetJ family transcriptional regulator